GGDQLHAVLVRPVVLDRGLVADQGHDDLARTGAVLLLYDDVVAGQDPGVDHAVAAGAQREQLLRLAEHLGELERAAIALLGEDRFAGGDATQNGDPGGGGRRAGADAARDAPRAPDVAGLFEQVQVVAHTIGRRDGELPADLANRGRRPL